MAWVDRLDIFDGSDKSAMKIGELYGNDRNSKLKSISSSGMMFIDFKKQHSASIFAYIDIKAELTAIIKYNKFVPECQNWLDLENSILKSPDKYDNNFNCSWLLSFNFGSHILLTFNSNNVSSNSLTNCTSLSSETIMTQCFL